VDTSNKQRDDHLRSADFFDVAKYPVISFTSNQIRKDGDKLIVRGTLEMHGKSQMVELPFQAAEGLNGAGKATWSYRATVPLNRLAFGVGAESLAAKLSLKNDVELDLLLVGFFEPAKAPVP
jgi:polyisoprenoid-binding protein YceI